MSARSVFLLGAMAVVLTAVGCAQPGRLTSSPPVVGAEAFTYEPMPRPVPHVPPKPAKPVVLRLRGPVIPEHDPAWEIHEPCRPWRFIVLHHSATHRGSAASFDNWHRHHNGWDELGYHFVIGNGTGSPDGTIEIGTRWPKQKHGAHCRVGDDETYNNYGIGICLVGDFEKGRPTAGQMRSLARLVDYLATVYRIPNERIIGHGDVDQTKCPGRNFSFEDLFQRLHRRRAAREALVGR